MTNKRYRDVDELLRTWADVHEPSSEHLEALRQQTTAAVPADRGGVSVATPRANGWFASPPFLVAAAASILAVIATAVWVARRSNDSNTGVGPRIAVVPESDPIDDPIERISPDQRLQKQTLLAELDRMFDGKRVWFAETESDVVLGGEARPSAAAIASETRVAMRLVLAKRASDTGPWQRVWSADVVSRTDQVVQFRSQDQPQAATSFTAWTHVLPDGLIACDVDVKWDNGIDGQLSDSLLLSPGDTARGASVSVDGVEYRLFHCVALLDEAKT